MIIRTIVSKYGDVQSYINKPVTDKLDFYNDSSAKVIGVIKDAIETVNGYELEIELFDKVPKFEWVGGKLSSFVIN
jgi:hypothetical protein